MNLESVLTSPADSSTDGLLNLQKMKLINWISRWRKSSKVSVIFIHFLNNHIVVNLTITNSILCNSCNTVGRVAYKVDQYSIRTTVHWKRTLLYTSIWVFTCLIFNAASNCWICPLCFLIVPIISFWLFSILFNLLNISSISVVPLILSKIAKIIIICILDNFFIIVILLFFLWRVYFEFINLRRRFFIRLCERLKKLQNYRPTIIYSIWTMGQNNLSETPHYPDNQTQIICRLTQSGQVINSKVKFKSL